MMIKENIKILRSEPKKTFCTKHDAPWMGYSECPLCKTDNGIITATSFFTSLMDKTKELERMIYGNSKLKNN